MKTYEDIFRGLKEELGNQLRFYLDEASGTGVLVLPFKDSMGDNFVIRVRENGGSYILDDGGLIKNTVFIMSETVGGTKSNKLVSGLVKSFDSRFDQAEGLIELAANQGQIIPKLLHFTKLLVTLDTMLVEVVKEERKEEKPHRVSLGPRASQRIRKSLTPLIKVEKVSHRLIMDGLTVPDWMVDFAYEPVVEPISQTTELVAIITVDLAVLDPIIKSAHAFSRAIDIKAAHGKYDIEIAFDTHGQNSNSLHAANFLIQHQIETKAYRTIDLSKSREYSELVSRINRETGMPLY